MLTAAFYIAFGAISAALAICMVRLVRGPDAVDRLIAFDTLYVNTIALLVVLDIYHSTSIYFEAALMIALTGFVSTAALGRYLARGKVTE
jgi:multicomponent K+:H+ antiporter subunit F